MYILDDYALFLVLQLRRNHIVDSSDQECFVAVLLVFCCIDLIKTADVFLNISDFHDVMRVEVFVDRRGESTDKEIAPEQVHDVVVE